jgi:hypothetical protein
MVHTLPDPEFVCLYVSQLTPGTDFIEVQRIIQDARHRHTDLRIRGALVFDGERFAQLIIGRQSALDAVGSFIENDARMTGLRLLHRGIDVPNFLPRWSSGYCGLLDMELVLDAGEGTAVQALLKVLEGAVMD